MSRIPWDVFQRAPVTNMILPSLGVVDEEPEVFASSREPAAGDLEPEVVEYIIGPGDVLDLSIFELFATGAEWVNRKQVSDTGRLTLPVVGTFVAAGQTELELMDTISDLLSPEIIKDPKVSVVVTGSRARVYSISGAVSSPGRYPLGENDFRIGDAMAQAGGIPQVNADYAYVIRTVSAAEMAAGRTANSGPSETDLTDLRPRPQDTGADMLTPAPTPSSLPEPAAPDAMDEEQDLLDSIGPVGAICPVTPMTRYAAAPAVKTAKADQDTPVVYAVQMPTPALKIIRRGDSFELVSSDQAQPAVPSSGVPEVPAPPRPQSQPQHTEPSQGFDTGGASVQEVIRIDLQKLRGGDLTQNIVVRSGDEIRVPLNSVGEFYVTGQVSRPGAYSLTGRKLTIKHALVSAGPMTALAWPSRCDVIRRIGDDREVIYRVNLEKIMNGTAPDIFLKPDDIINVGSHPVARWMATIRQSFRATYGFGFVYDRNLADKDAGN